MHTSTKRLKLREVKDSDIDFSSAYQRDTRDLKHYTTIPDAAGVIIKAKNWPIEIPRLNHQFAITLGDESPAIGCGGVRDREDLHKRKFAKGLPVRHKDTGNI